MRVLQTLGEREHEGIFQYRRGVDGIEIDASIGRAESLHGAKVVLLHDEWRLILEAIAGQKGSLFRLTGTRTRAVPRQSLRDTIKGAVPAPAGGWAWTDSWASYVAAILEHEGSVDLYGGPCGRGRGVPIVLSRDV
jgi:hypothetical protein